MEPGPWKQKKRSDRKDMQRQTKYTEAVYVTEESLGGGVRGRAGGRGERGA
jgi:hypothetical protein